MKPYPCRRIQGRDMPQVEEACIKTQEGWAGIKAPISWDQTLRADVQQKLLSLGAFAADGTTLLGSLLASRQPNAVPPSLCVVGMTADDKLTHDEQLGVCYSLLLAGYPYCTGAADPYGEAMSLARGYGDLEATNELLLEVFDTIKNFQMRVSGREPGPEPWPERKPHVYHIEVNIDESYRLALEKALEALP